VIFAPAIPDTPDNAIVSDIMSAATNTTTMRLRI
jgi:hypothetical protein